MSGLLYEQSYFPYRGCSILVSISGRRVFDSYDSIHLRNQNMASNGRHEYSSFDQNEAEDVSYIRAGSACPVTASPAH